MSYHIAHILTHLMKVGLRKKGSTWPMKPRDAAAPPAHSEALYCGECGMDDQTGLVWECRVREVSLREGEAQLRGSGLPRRSLGTRRVGPVFAAHGAVFSVS